MYPGLVRITDLRMFFPSGCLTFSFSNSRNRNHRSRPSARLRTRGHPNMVLQQTPGAQKHRQNDVEGHGLRSKKKTLTAIKIKSFPAFF